MKAGVVTGDVTRDDAVDDDGRKRGDRAPETSNNSVVVLTKRRKSY